MSSAILYLAIVAIWAFLLVPRWIHRPGSVTAADAGAPAGPSAGDDYPEAAEPDDDTAPIPAVAAPPVPPAPAPEPAWTSSATDSPASPAAPARPRVPPGPPRPPRPSLSRGKVLQARRRLLTILVLLAMAAAACTAARLSSLWVCIPPAVMLGLYVLLLRETAIADAEQARRRAEHAAAAARRRSRQQAARARQTARAPGAKVIDISARLTDQLYDQYADATIRAVGD